jgi:hypothetical protein
MIKITPFLVGFPTQEEANCLEISPEIKSTTDVCCRANWSLYNSSKHFEKRFQGFDDENKPVLLDVEVEKKKILFSGTVEITESEYALWGADNTVIEDVVMIKIGVTRAVDL